MDTGLYDRYGDSGKPEAGNIFVGIFHDFLFDSGGGVQRCGEPDGIPGGQQRHRDDSGRFIREGEPLIQHSDRPFHQAVSDIQADQRYVQRSSDARKSPAAGSTGADPPNRRHYHDYGAGSGTGVYPAGGSSASYDCRGGGLKEDDSHVLRSAGAGGPVCAADPGRYCGYPCD